MYIEKSVTDVTHEIGIDLGLFFYNHCMNRIEAAKHSCLKAANVLREVDTRIIDDLDYVERKWQERLDRLAERILEKREELLGEGSSSGDL